jgi:hypothetical protein
VRWRRRWQWWLESPPQLSLGNDLVELFLLVRPQDRPHFVVRLRQDGFDLGLHLSADALNLLLGVRDDGAQLVALRAIETQLPAQPAHEEIRLVSEAMSDDADRNQSACQRPEQKHRNDSKDSFPTFHFILLPDG